MSKESQRRKPRNNFDRVRTFEGCSREDCFKEANTYALENNLRIVSFLEPDVFKPWAGAIWFKYTIIFDRM